MDAGVPGILQSRGWYPAYQAVQSETTDREHLLQIVNSARLCYEVFPKLSFKCAGSSCFGICCWVDDQVVGGKLLYRTCLCAK